jgi:hypothetical protein
MRTTTIVSLLICALAAIGCAPADVSGSYTVALTNQENTCLFDWWQADQETTGVTVDVVQDGGDVRLTVTGLAGGFLTLGIGSNVFTGTVSGNHVSADIFGTVDQTEGGCANPYQVDVDLRGDLNGDALSGDIAYTPHDYECFPAGCENIQRFSGSRPPR